MKNFDTLETVLFTVADRVAHVTLNRPQTLNSFNEKMHLELRTVLKHCWNDSSVSAIVLAGNGKGFCAGQDLGDRKTTPGDDAFVDLSDTIERNYNPLIRTLTAMPKPIVCAVGGVAAGAGVSIALACDIVVASKSASFVQSFTKVGLVPDSGGSWNLVNAVGLPRARAMSLLGERIKAETALSWGLIYDVVENEELQPRCQELATTLTTLAPRAISETKLLLQEACHSTLNSQLERERAKMRELGASKDYREGVTAFFEKRKANFTGE